MNEENIHEPLNIQNTNQDISTPDNLFYNHVDNMDHQNNNYTRQPKVIRQVIILEKEPTIIDLVPLIFTMIIYMLLIQTCCMIIKKTCRRFYDKLVFGILFICPPSFFFISGKFIFPIFWIAYALFMILIYYKINKKPLPKEMPRKIFNIFKGLFIITNIGICIFQTLTILSFLLFPTAVVHFFIYFMFFLYFGLLSRETIFFFSETMATNTGFYSQEGVPSRNNNSALCMICTKVFDNTELIHTLICNHSFHENCIKGWCMIAKKNSCPHCKKGVDLNTIPKDLWYRTEVWFYPLINTLRNFIVFSVSLTLFIFYRLSIGK